MKKKRILLYISKFMNIYQDIKECLENMNFEVIWIEANTIPNNPFFRMLGLYNQTNIDNYISKCTAKWIKLFEEKKTKEPFDFFLSINGMDTPPFLFEELRKCNPYIQKILYLYDRVEGVYEIDCFFKYYNKVFSFDRNDCQNFGLEFLPIYWIPNSNKNINNKYDIFAFASYSYLKPDRTILFSKLKKIAKKNKYREFIKLYDCAYRTNKFKFIVKNIILILLKRNALTLFDLYNGLITGISVIPSEYRQLIGRSRVIFDTHASYQDGLTARFMWALGLGKKIITTNHHIQKYDFYDKDQIFIINNNLDDVKAFIEKEYVVCPSQKKKIESFRIDNWIKKLLY